MSLSIRMERVHKIKSPQKRLWRFKIAVTDTNYLDRVLRELGFTNIRYMSTLPEEDMETIYEVVATSKDGKAIAVKGNSSKSWEFAGYGKEKDVQQLSRRFVDLLGAYHTMAVLDVQGINYETSKNENRIVIQVT